MLATLLQMESGTITIGTIAETKQKSITLMSKGKQPLAVIFDENDADSVSSVSQQIEQYIGNQDSIVDATNITTITKATPDKGTGNKSAHNKSAGARAANAMADKPQTSEATAPTKSRKAASDKTATAPKPQKSAKSPDDFSDLLSDLGI
ncbi:hypothetical protein ACP3V3_01690 [Vibrio sp. PNB22_3_1]